MSDALNSVDRIKLLMIDTFGSKFKKYYDGDPDVIPKFNLPCIIVQQVRDDTAEAEMGQDDVTDQIRIKVLYDRADDWTGATSDGDLTEKKLRDVVGTTVTSDRQYKPGTIKHAIRKELLNRDVEAVAPTMSIEFGVNPRETLQSEENAAWTAEAWVTFGVKFSVDTYQ